MKKVIAAILMAFALVSTVYAGNCNTPDDIAADGSRCGGRSAQSRPGGK